MFTSPNEARTPSPTGLIHTDLLKQRLQVLMKNKIHKPRQLNFLLYYTLPPSNFAPGLYLCQSANIKYDTIGLHNNLFGYHITVFFFTTNIVSREKAGSNSLVVKIGTKRPPELIHCRYKMYCSRQLHFIPVYFGYNATENYYRHNMT